MVILVGSSFETGALNPEGHTGSFWIVGMIIYCYVVIQVNFEIAYQTHTHCFISISLQALSILLFFLMYYIQSIIDKIPVF